MSILGWGEPPKYDLSDRLFKEMKKITSADRDNVVSRVIGIPQLKSMNIRLLALCLDLFAISGEDIKISIKNIPEYLKKAIEVLSQAATRENMDRLQLNMILYFRTLDVYFQSQKGGNYENLLQNLLNDLYQRFQLYSDFSQDELYQNMLEDLYQLFKPYPQVEYVGDELYGKLYNDLYQEFPSYSGLAEYEELRNRLFAELSDRLFGE